MTNPTPSADVPWAAIRDQDQAMPVPNTSMLPEGTTTPSAHSHVAWTKRLRGAVRGSPLVSVAGAFALGAFIVRITH